MTYYTKNTIRGMIIGLYWIAMAVALLLAISWAMTDTTAIDCPITFHRNFTYSTTDWYPSMDCVMPDNVSVDTRGNWWWTS